jgi:S-DNA-T family DNA segregation ATPase FtsK/SpoIIIE
MSMPAIERVIPLVGHLPAAIREALARRLRELTGLALLSVSGVGAAALMTWSVQDPSLSHATSRAIRNIVGYPGAIFADLMMQIPASARLPILRSRYGLAHADPSYLTAKRCGSGAGSCTVISAGFASCWARGGAWPLPTGLGGVVGDALVRAPAVVFGPPGIVYRLVLGIILFAAVVVTFLIASGMGSRPQEDELTPIADDDAPFVEEEDDGSVSLGWAFHAVMSAKARVWRMLVRAYSWLVSSAPPPRTSFERHEPNLGGRAAPSLAPQAEDDLEDEDEDDEDEIPAARAPRKKAAPKAPARKSWFELPPVSVLTAPKASDRQPLSKSDLDTNSRALEGVLGDFGVRGEIVKAHPGPVVTLYELEPAPGIKSSRVIGLSDDIARSMSALSARVAVVPGRNAIGIELPNPHREKVYLRELLTAKDGNESVAKLPLCLGKNIGGESIIVDLARMPHLLIAGTTGSGKSVAINTMILSLVYRLRPDQCRLIMVDPKMLELSVYDGIPHLLTPVVTDPKKAVVALKWAVREMEERYKKMSKLGVRNIDGYNARLVEAKSKGEELTRTVHTGFDKETGKAIYENEQLDLEPLPYIVIIVDEMADLMMVAGKDIEGAVQRLAQMARRRSARDLATQRPSVDVITGTIRPTSRPVSRSGDLENRQPHHSRRNGCRAAAGAGRHALYGRRRTNQPRARAVRIRRGGREGGAPSQVARCPRIPRGGHRGRADRRGRRGVRFNRHGRRRRRRRPVFAGRGDRQARPQGLHQLHSAPAPDRI